MARVRGRRWGGAGAAGAAGAIDATEQELGIHVLAPDTAQRAFEGLVDDAEDDTMRSVHCADLHRHISKQKDSSRIGETMIELCVRKTLGGGCFAPEVLAIVTAIMGISRGSKHCHLYVAPGWRGMGLGSTLLQAATSIAYRGGCSEVRLGQAFLGRKVEAVQEWWLKRGFKRPLGWRPGEVQVLAETGISFTNLKIQEATVPMRVYVTQSVHRDGSFLLRITSAPSKRTKGKGKATAPT